MSDFEIVKFSESYDLATFVWSHITEWSHPAAFESLLNPADSEVAERFAKPHRDTLLHLFLRRLYQEAYIEEFEHSRNDMLDIVASEYESVLKFNEVPFKRMSFPEEGDLDYDCKAEARIAYLRSRLPLVRIAQDTFQLLFRDRAFLLRFNQVAARALRKWASKRRGREPAHPILIKRIPLPTWLKRGVFYRDNGRCVRCGKDLTGAVVTSEALHYDHILPLASGGSNDPTNFQLLCGGCNLQKAVTAITSERYPVFWSLEPSVAGSALPSNPRLETGAQPARQGRAAVGAGRSTVGRQP